MDKNYQKYLSVTAGIMLVLATFANWPYGYFQMLRWVISGVAIYNAYFARELKKDGWVLLMAAIAILFNPIEPVILEKQVWAVIDLIIGAIFFASIFLLKPNVKIRGILKVIILGDFGLHILLPVVCILIAVLVAIIVSFVFF